MGIGGTVGQGDSACATLAWSGPVSLAPIAARAMIGLHQLIGGYQTD